MTYSIQSRQLALALALVATALMVRSQPAVARCDTVDGQVVTSARQALAHGDVTPVLESGANVEAHESHERFSAGSLFNLPQEVGDGPGKEVSVLLDEEYLKLAVLTLRQGTILPSHSAPVPTTIHVLQGEGIIHVDTESIPVSEGSLVSLQAGAAHDVVPEEGSDILLLVHYLRSAGAATTPSAEGH